MTVVLYALGVAFVALGVGASIALHEIGHLLPAKRFGVKCKQYMIGFGPTVWSRHTPETEYGVKAIPLGGYVRMIGMYPPRPQDRPGELRASNTGRMATLVDQARKESMDEVAPGEENRVFYKLSVPKKVVVMLGGPVMNLVLATVLLAVALCLVGVPTAVPTVASVGACVPTAAPSAQQPQPECRPSDPSSPAARAGLQVGDTITAVNGDAVQSFGQVTSVIRASAGQTVALTVSRPGVDEPVTLAVPLATLSRAVYTDSGQPKLDANGAVVTEPVGYLGASASSGFVRQSPLQVPATMATMVGQTGQALLTVPAKMVGVVQAVTGQAERDPNGPMSVVGVGRAGGEVASGSVGIGDGSARSVVFLLLSMLVGLNLALFMFNLIPLLPLDGGHVVGALWEGLKRSVARLLGRPDPGYVDVAKALPIAYAVSSVVIVMAVLLIYADLVSPVKLAG
ncbi:MAG: M50 family metallopeptidase [Dermatophilaceae bacterium]